MADGVADRGGSGLGWLLYLGEAEVLVDFLDGRLEEDRGALLTVLGRAQITRSYYLCGQCHHGQFPADGQLDLDGTELSPGVRRMLAVVGAAAPFDRRRQQLEVLAGLRTTAKAVERTAEAIGCDIAQGEQREIQRAVQLDLPMVMGEPIPILYVQMDGTGVPW